MLTFDTLKKHSRPLISRPSLPSSKVAHIRITLLLGTSLLNSLLMILMLVLLHGLLPGLLWIGLMNLNTRNTNALFRVDLLTQGTQNLIYWRGQ